MVANGEVRMHDVMGIYLHVGTNSVSYSASTTYVYGIVKLKPCVLYHGRTTIMTHLINFHLVWCSTYALKR